MNLFSRLSSLPHWEGAAYIINTLLKHGYEAFLVGGAVRDLLLGGRPEDLDISTNARPEVVARLFPRTLKVGAAFGVVIVRYKGKSYEVATYRRDLAYNDGRRPSGVEFTNAREDVLRRDFTINGMMYDVRTRRVVDYVGGREDLQKHLIRTIGKPERRFAEDYLRLIRAVRFAARLDFRLEERTFLAIRRQAQNLRTVSRERLRDELIKIMQTDHPLTGLQFLLESSLLKVILDALPQGRFTFPRALQLSERMQFPQISRGLRSQAFFIFLTTDLGDSGAAGKRLSLLLQALKFSNRYKYDALTVQKDLLLLRDFGDLRRADRMRLIRSPGCLPAQELGELLYDLDVSPVRAFRAEQAGRNLFPSPLLTGNDLINAGMEPGPYFSPLLHELESLQLEERLTNSADALEWALTHFNKFRR